MFTFICDLLMCNVSDAPTGHLRKRPHCLFSRDITSVITAQLHQHNPAWMLMLTLTLTLGCLSQNVTPQNQNLRKHCWSREAHPNNYTMWKDQKWMIQRIEALTIQMWVRTEGKLKQFRY